jgi:hypothetical protein
LKYQIIFIEKRRSRLVACGTGRIEREFSQQTLAARVSSGNLCKLHQVRWTRDCLIVKALQMRLVPTTDEIKLCRPAHRTSAQHAYGGLELRPEFGGCRRRPEFTQASDRVGTVRHAVEELRG